MSHEDLYLEKMKISERLQSVENTLLVHTTKITDWMEKTQNLLNKHSEEIWGNGKPGLKTNVDRILFVGKFAWVLYVSVAALLVERAWELFKR